MDRKKETLFLFGIHPVLENLRASPQEVVEVLIARSQGGASLRSIEEEARRLRVPIRFVDSRVLDQIAGGGKHQGVLAKVESYLYGDFAHLLEELSSAQGDNWILVLDGLTDPRNFGALLRSAEAVGVRHVVIPKDRSVGVTPTVVKSSAGAAHYLKIYRVSNLRHAVQALKERGYWAIGLDAGARESIYARAYPDKLIVILGAEGTGMRRLIRQECDFLVSIPMRGKIASLNVAVAGALFMYELLRQRDKV